MSTQIQPERLAWLESATLDYGAHAGLEGGVCAMEAAAFIAGEPWSDHPQCVCPVIAAFCRSWNDTLGDDRNRILKPLIPLVIGTRGNTALESRRAWMATDWLIRTYLPAWLRLAAATHPDLADHACSLAALPEITSGSDWGRYKAGISSARAAAWDAARSAAGAALRQVVAELQDSAVALIRRMIAAKESEPR